MLSKTDIINELGKGICIFPLNSENIKENSINLCASKFAWVTQNASVFICEKEKNKDKYFSLQKDNKHNKEIKLKKGESAVVLDKFGNSYIVLLPLSTTLIETQEVLSVNSYVGGTYHSKVGMVSKGIGHIGTMVGPNFSGESLISLHNPTRDLIIIKVGDSFVSVVFHYLDTPYHQLNPTVGGHIDKFSQLGLKVTDEQLTELSADWKKKIEDVRYKMCQSEEFKKLQIECKKQKVELLKKFFNKRNIIICSVSIVVLVGLYFVAYYLDKGTNNTAWVDRYFNVGFSGVLVTIISVVAKVLKNNIK